jgi:hypothetical protein
MNTSYDVLRVGGTYLLCYSGAWYDASSPIGPWVLTSSVPDEVYAIPASSPSYPVTYVAVEDSTDVSVTYVYTSGYHGMYTYYGVPMYGTGWYYPPYYYPYPYYPIYYPIPSHMARGHSITPKLVAMAV